MKEIPMLFSDSMVRAILDGRKTQTRRLTNGLRFLTSCPYAVGDVIWVRECFTGAKGECIGLRYRADGDIPNVTWTPSIHMPKWACRLFLDVTRVRCERLRDISEADAIAEGLAFIPPLAYIGTGGNFYSEPKFAFRDLWDSIYGNRPGCDWAANPWVFVIDFTRRST